jgi:hypothetical protein
MGGGQEFPVPVKLVGRVPQPASVSYLIPLQSMGMVAGKPTIVANGEDVLRFMLRRIRQHLLGGF